MQDERIELEGDDELCVIRRFRSFGAASRSDESPVGIPVENVLYELSSRETLSCRLSKIRHEASSAPGSFMGVKQGDPRIYCLLTAILLVVGQQASHIITF
jgi:hypothetical protein